MSVVALALAIIGLSVVAVGLGVSPRGRVPALSRPVRAGLVGVGLLLFGGGGVVASQSTDVPQSELRGAATALPAPTMVPLEFVVTPDVRGLTPAEATANLQALGMDLGESRSSCRELGAQPLDPLPPSGTIVCQAVAPGVMAAVGVAIDYVLMR